MKIAGGILDDYNKSMEDQDRQYMAVAIKQAVIAKQKGDVPFGAVIVRHGRIIVESANSEHLDQDVTRHAEVKAVSEASRILGRRDLSDALSTAPSNLARCARVPFFMPAYPGSCSPCPEMICPTYSGLAKSDSGI